MRCVGAVSVVGSYLLHTLSKPDLHVDVAVTMPEASLEVIRRCATSTLARTGRLILFVSAL
jgi:hypothetical protein